MRQPDRLPLRWLGVETVYSTPGDDMAVARKAIRHGTSPMARLLERHTISEEMLAESLGTDAVRVAALLADPRPAGAVMLDAEDAIVDARPSGVAAGNVALLLGESGWPPGMLRLWRPGLVPGHRLEPHLAALAAAPMAAAPDAIVVPKVARASDVAGLDAALTGWEDRVGWPPGGLGVLLMVETARAVGSLLEIVDVARPRLRGLIFGSVDYAAELRLPYQGAVVLDFARATVVNAAAAAGVPAIDSMTLDFPAVPAGLSARDGREIFLARMALAYRDARHAADVGMSGKLVGHPAQLFAVRVAFDELRSTPVIEKAAADLAAYMAAAAGGRGITTVDGRMVDRATAGMAREILRTALANGRMARERARELGVVGEDETP